MRRFPALEAQVAQAQTDLTRAEDLFSRGTIPKTNLDQARTAFNVASNTLKARTAERSVIQQQVTEGKVLAPTAGRVLKVPVTTGTVILPGETVATVAEQNFILRLRVPERHARFLKVGDPRAHRRRGDRQERRAIRHHPPGLSADRGRPRGRRRRGRQSRRLFRRRARPRLGLRPASATSVIVPGAFIITRFGIDYARVRKGADVIDVPVQRGRPQPRPDMPDALEILSGLNSGDVLVRP